jgi:hypothetical protein
VKSQSDDKESVSRRGFAKSIAAALAVIPFASTLADAQRRRGQRRTGTRDSQSPARRAAAPAAAFDGSRNEHDTPPPVLFMNGSFIVETEKDFDPGDIIPTGSKKRHHIKPRVAANNRVFPAHIKIVDGSGEMLFRLDSKDSGVNPHPAEDIKITALLNEGTTVEAASIVGAGNMQTFAIDVNNGKSLLPPTTSGDLPVGVKRGARRRVKSAPGDMSDTSINELTITNVRRNKILFNVVPGADLASKGEELRVMIWLEEKKV